MARNAVALVTGGTTGIGFVACQQLVEQGVDVILTSRTVAKGKAAVEKIRGVCHPLNHAKVEYIIMELSNLHSVSEACDGLKGRNIDYLLLNAGVMSAGSKEIKFTDDGIESTVGVNHVASALMALKLFPIMEATKSVATNPMITFVSSDLHNAQSVTGAPKRVGPPVKDESVRYLAETRDLDGSKMFELPKDDPHHMIYDPSFCYKYSKLLNIISMKALHKKLSKSSISCNAMEPGFIPASDLSRSAKEMLGPTLARVLVWNLYHGPINWLVRRTLGQPVRTLTEGAASEVYALRNGNGGVYYRLDEAEAPSPLAEDEALVDSLWNATLQILRSKGFDN